MGGVTFDGVGFDQPGLRWIGHASICCRLVWVESDWTGLVRCWLGWIVLGWVGLGLVGACIKFGWIASVWFGFDWAVLDLAVLERIVLGWAKS